VKEYLLGNPNKSFSSEKLKIPPLLKMLGFAAARARPQTPLSSLPPKKIALLT
jgi:hypothetical protein